MSWSFNIKGTPSGVIEQLVNKPDPHGQNELGVKQFRTCRDGLIEQVRTIRENGLSPRADAVVVAAYGHANDDGTGNFGVTLSLTLLAPPPEPTPAPPVASPEPLGLTAVAETVVTPPVDTATEAQTITTDDVGSVSDVV
jgi:hypothetical protein